VRSVGVLAPVVFSFSPSFSFDLVNLSISHHPHNQKACANMGKQEYGQKACSSGPPAHHKCVPCLSTPH
jgi:hypothetical protein